MIVDTLGNEKLNSTVTELIIGGRKLNISLAFITQSYFFVPNNNIRLEMKNLQYNINIKICNTILTILTLKYQHYHLKKLINVNILQVKKFCLLIKEQIIEQANFAYSPL